MVFLRGATSIFLGVNAKHAARIFDKVKSDHWHLDAKEIFKARGFKDVLLDILNKIFGGSTNKKDLEMVCDCIYDVQRACFKVIASEDLLLSHTIKSFAELIKYANSEDLDKFKITLNQEKGKNTISFSIDDLCIHEITLLGFDEMKLALLAREIMEHKISYTVKTEEILIDNELSVGSDAWDILDKQLTSKIYDEIESSEESGYTNPVSTRHVKDILREGYFLNKVSTSDSIFFQKSPPILSAFDSYEDYKKIVISHDNEGLQKLRQLVELSCRTDSADQIKSDVINKILLEISHKLDQNIAIAINKMLISDEGLLPAHFNESYKILPVDLSSPCFTIELQADHTFLLGVKCHGPVGRLVYLHEGGIQCQDLELGDGSYMHLDAAVIISSDGSKIMGLSKEHPIKIKCLLKNMEMHD